MGLYRRYCLGLVFYDDHAWLGPFIPIQAVCAHCGSDWPEQAGADFLIQPTYSPPIVRRKSHNMNDPCGARCPDLPRVRNPPRCTAMTKRPIPANSISRLGVGTEVKFLVHTPH